MSWMKLQRRRRTAIGRQPSTTFRASTGLLLNEEGLCVHFTQIIVSKQGESRKISNTDLQDYMDRITKGWNGDRSKMFACLWFVLQAGEYESKLDSSRKEHKSQANDYLTLSRSGRYIRAVGIDYRKEWQSLTGRRSNGFLSSRWSVLGGLLLMQSLWIAAKNTRKHTWNLE